MGLIADRRRDLVAPVGGSDDTAGVAVDGHHGVTLRADVFRVHCIQISTGGMSIGRVVSHRHCTRSVASSDHVFDFGLKAVQVQRGWRWRTGWTQRGGVRAALLEKIVDTFGNLNSGILSNKIAALMMFQEVKNSDSLYLNAERDF